MTRDTDCGSPSSTVAAAAAAGEGTERSDKEIHYAVAATGSSLSRPTRGGGRQLSTQIGERAGSEDIEREEERWLSNVKTGECTNDNASAAIKESVLRLDGRPIELEESVPTRRCVRFEFQKSLDRSCGKWCCFPSAVA